METKKIGIVSGKGGVGKTSLTASLASLAKRDPDMQVIALDCDVDAPNLALILPPENKSTINKEDTYATRKAEFCEEKCTKCKQCIEEHFCEFNALDWDTQNSIPIINFLKCEGCGACKVLCPEHAFKIHSVKSGEIISYKTAMGFPLIYGKTQLGSTTSGKLVSDVKESLNNLKEKNNSNLILIDGPPGIGCPVIATISNLDYVIAITEPTPSGLHDLIRVLEVIQHFGIPFGLIVNKSDLRSHFREEFKSFINNTGFRKLGDIPFDLSIPKAMSYAEPVVEFAPESKASKAIKIIFENLKKILWNND
ncbi:MAG: ATP-binding protein [Candidatus Heimdallarchaeota archaeon]